MNDLDNQQDGPGEGLSIADRKRAAGQEGMPDELFRVFESIHQYLSEHNSNEAIAKYEIGTQVAEVLQNANTYGGRAVARLAKALGLDSTTLRDYARVAGTWPRKAFEVLMEQRDSHRLPISFSHLIEISAVTDTTERRQWINNVLDGGWSVRQLRNEMAADANQPVTGGESTELELDDNVETDVTGPADTPVTVSRSIMRMRSDIELIPSLMVTWQERVFVPLGHNPARFGQTALDELQQTRNVCAQAFQSLQVLMRQIDDAILMGRAALGADEHAADEEGGDADGD